MAVRPPARTATAGQGGLSYRVRLAGGFALLLTLMTGAVVTATVEVHAISATRDREVGMSAQYVFDLADVAVTAKAMANDERGYLLSGQDSFTTEAMGRVPVIDAALARAAQHGGPAAAGIVADIRTAIHAWTDQVSAEFAQAKSDHAAAVTTALGPNRDLRKVYEGKLGAEEKAAQARLLDGKGVAAAARQSYIVLWGLLALTLALGVAVAVNCLRASAGPLRRAAHVLQAAAAGDLRERMEHGRADEFGSLARALNTTLDNTARIVAEIGGVSGALAGAAAGLADVNGHIGGTAQAVSGQAAAAAGTAEQVSRSVATVAAGSEQMGASIREIATNASEAATVSQRAVEAASTAGATIAQLGRSSSEIGNVVNLITAIAEQTNLLALNATIEAARAGETGKGFAVVAGEVKDLAQQTAKATDDISGRINEIQSSATGAVQAIEEITEVIGKMNDYATTIAGAVEEQSSTTAEITRSVTEAATGAGLIAENIQSVAEAAGTTTTEVGESRRAADEVATMSGRLQDLVAHFTC